MDDVSRAHLAALASADASVALGPVGYAAIVSEPCRAYLALEADRAALARLEPYRDDRRPCSMAPGGCIVYSSWMCETVYWVLTGEHWAHPDRLLEMELSNLAGANWFELPSTRLLDTHGRAGEATETWPPAAGCSRSPSCSSTEKSSQEPGPL